VAAEAEAPEPEVAAEAEAPEPEVAAAAEAPEPEAEAEAEAEAAEEAPEAAPDPGTSSLDPEAPEQPQPDREDAPRLLLRGGRHDPGHSPVRGRPRPASPCTCCRRYDPARVPPRRAVPPGRGHRERHERFS